MMTEYERVLAAWPTLGMSGFNDMRPYTPIPEEIECCRRWLREGKGRWGRMRKGTSYGIKHTVEAWYRDQGISQYVSNTSFIVAAVLEGWVPTQRRGFERSPNCTFRRQNKDGV